MESTTRLSVRQAFINKYSAVEVGKCDNRGPSLIKQLIEFFMKSLPAVRIIGNHFLTDLDYLFTCNFTANKFHNFDKFPKMSCLLDILSMLTEGLKVLPVF